jgi:hypothetical protein
MDDDYQNDQAEVDVKAKGPMSSTMSSKATTPTNGEPASVLLLVYMWTQKANC